MITQEESVRYKEALEKLYNYVDGKCHMGTIAQMVFTITQEALAPPVEMEEVEVKHYILRFHDNDLPTNVCASVWQNKESAEGYAKLCTIPCHVVELTETIFRPQPKKVLRR